MIDPSQRSDTHADLAGRFSCWLRKKVAIGWLLVVIAGFAVTLFGWWLRIRPSAPVWGPVAEWVSGLGQLAALIFLAWQILLLRADQDHQSRREATSAKAEREARAKAVAVAVMCPSSHRIVCDATNGGLFPVHGVTLATAQITDGGTESPSEAKQTGVGGVLFPGSPPSRTEFVVSSEVDRSKQCVIIEFGDAWGYRWRRVLDLEGAEIKPVSEISSPTIRE